jgi:hypothetical protein
MMQNGSGSVAPFHEAACLATCENTAADWRATSFKRPAGSGEVPEREMSSGHRDATADDRNKCVYEVARLLEHLSPRLFAIGHKGCACSKRFEEIGSRDGTSCSGQACPMGQRKTNREKTKVAAIGLE